MEIENKLQKEMSLEHVQDLYAELGAAGVEIWLDGGWGVDVLLGEQTRAHRDLDIAIQEKDVSTLRSSLKKRGYEQIKEDNKWNFVLADKDGHEIDVHSFVFGDDGKSVVGGIPYPAGSLTGNGQLGGRNLRCISPEHMVRFHTGYELKEKDYQDVKALCRKFGIEPPEE